MLLIMQSEMTQESIGLRVLNTSTGSSVVSLPLVRNTGDYVERDTSTTRHVLLAGQTGREITPSPFVATVRFCCCFQLLHLFFGYCLAETVVVIWSLKFWILKDLNYVLLKNFISWYLELVLHCVFFVILIFILVQLMILKLLP